MHFQEQDFIVEYCHAKQGQRHGNDSAIVNSAARFVVDTKSNVLKEATFAFGGVANRPYMVAVKSEIDLK